MAAPGEDREGSFCARCFAHVDAGEAYCPECGAPTGEAMPAADSAVHGQLAQANLLRLRGDLDGSEKALLNVLRRFPNDPHAHEMLGDVCLERGEAARAVEWYELALDLAPNSADVRSKLEAAGERQDARTVADTAKTLGLPAARPLAAWWPLAASAGLLALAIAVAAWPRPAAAKPLRATVVAPAPPPAEIAVANVPALPTTPAPTSVETPPPSGTDEDRQLLSEVQKGAGTTRVQTVALDPRTQALAVTFEVAETDDPKAVATALGKAALAAAPTAMSTTLRAVRSGRLVFAADLARSAMANPEPLTNLWPASTPSSPEAPAPATPPANPAATTGTAPAGNGEGRSTG